MRIAAATIENFRCIERIECTFDSITTFLGPNGAGKSTILRALDWCLNADKGALSDSDRHAGAPADAHIRVRIDFAGLTDADRCTLGPKYAPPGADTFTLWRTWRPDEEKLTGKALAYQPFEQVRAATTATDKRALYNSLRGDRPELALPPCSSAQAVDAAMDQWETGHPGDLTEAEVSDTNLFGFNGRGQIAEIFDFIFVSADLRAGEEASDGKDTTLGRILQRALDRSSLQNAITTLTSTFESDYGKLNTEHLSPQLTALQENLSREVSVFSHGRSIHLTPSLPTIKPQFPRIDLLVGNGSLRTPVPSQGHGFQRALLLGALTVLSRHAHPSDTQMFLAIEEPELFQHPTQARAFSSVLRELAGSSSNGIQVAYATHSPYFVDPRYFDQVRRVTNTTWAAGVCPSSTLTSATTDAVETRLRGFVDPDAIKRRWDQVCLKYLPEALFAETVILVEGDEDAAILQGLSERPPNDLAAAGICVAAVSGKGNMMIPFAILKQLGIQTLMVVDNDQGCRGRMLANGRTEDQILEAEEKHKKDNRALCRLVGGTQEDYPLGQVSLELFFIADTLESMLSADLPGWDQKRRELIESGRGVDGKNAGTYELAARECAEKAGMGLATVLGFMSIAA